MSTTTKKSLFWRQKFLGKAPKIELKMLKLIENHVKDRGMGYALVNTLEINQL